MSDADLVSQSSEFEVLVVLNGGGDGKASPFLTINTDVSYFVPRPPSTLTTASANNLSACSLCESPVSPAADPATAGPECVEPKCVEPECVEPTCVERECACVSSDSDSGSIDAASIELVENPMSAGGCEQPSPVRLGEMPAQPKCEPALSKPRLTVPRGRKAGRKKRKKPRPVVAPLVLLGFFFVIALL